MDSLQNLEGNSSTVKPGNAHRKQKQAVGPRSDCKNSLLIQLEDSGGDRDRRRLFGAAVFKISNCARSESVRISLLLQLVNQTIM